MLRPLNIMRQIMSMHLTAVLWRKIIQKNKWNKVTRSDSELDWQLVGNEETSSINPQDN